MVKAPRPPLSISPAAQARRLRALLDAKGWTQAELVRRTGISGPSINRYCKGGRPISKNDLRKIAHATGLPVGYILEGDDRGLTDDQRKQLLPDA